MGLSLVLDVAHDEMDEDRRDFYLHSVYKMAQVIYKLCGKVKWSGAPYDVFPDAESLASMNALLVAAMLADKHNFNRPRSHTWKKWVTEAMLHALNGPLLVTLDGSTTRSAFQTNKISHHLSLFAALAQRHGIYDLKKHPWLRQHLDFFQHALLPGYQRVVSYSQPDGVYLDGLESQLHFLDRFILRDGKASWLARQVRKSRTLRSVENREQDDSLHLLTELLWRDPAIEERFFSMTNFPKLHVFSTWGVATYGGGLPSGHAFLSMKCGYPRYRAVNVCSERARSSSSLSDWKEDTVESLDPACSLVFSPRRRSNGDKISSARGPLFLGGSLVIRSADFNFTFSSSDEGGFYKKTYEESLIGAYEDDGMVFSVGRFVQKFGASQELATLYRSVLLLSPDALLVTDSIYWPHPYRAGEVLYQRWLHDSGTMFLVDSEQSSAYLHLNGQRYAIRWLASGASFDFADSEVIDGRGGLTISWRARQRTICTHVVRLLTSSEVEVGQFSLGPTSVLGIELTIVLGSAKFVVSIATTDRSLIARQNWLGSIGYAHVSGPNLTTVFGAQLKDRKPLQKPQHRSPHCSVENLEWTAFLVLFVLASCVTLQCRYSKTRVVGCGIIQVAIVVSVLVYLSDLDTVTKGAFCRHPDFPHVFLTGLPGSGVEIIRHVLQYQHGLRMVSVDGLNPEKQSDAGRLAFYLAHFNHVASCRWERQAAVQRHYQVVERSLYCLLNPLACAEDMDVPEEAASNQDATSSLPDLTELKSLDYYSLIYDESGVWTARAGWLLEVLKFSGRVVIMVRDPRNWVFEQLRVSARKGKSYLERMLYNAQMKVYPKCGDGFEFSVLQSILSSTQPLKEPHRFLSALWAVNTRNALRQFPASLGNPTKTAYLVRFEDILRHPEAGIRNLTQWLGIPLRVQALSRLLHVLKSEMVEISPHGVVTERLLKMWTEEDTREVRAIETICALLMNDLGYTVE